jgi:hypothetical protein
LPNWGRWPRQGAIRNLASANSINCSSQSVEINVQPIDRNDSEQAACANANRGIAHARPIFAFPHEARKPQEIQSVPQKITDAQTDTAVQIFGQIHDWWEADCLSRRCRQESGSLGFSNCTTTQNPETRIVFQRGAIQYKKSNSQSVARARGSGLPDRGFH